jgi:hypothetical protein
MLRSRRPGPIVTNNLEVNYTIKQAGDVGDDGLPRRGRRRDQELHAADAAGTRTLSWNLR